MVGAKDGRWGLAWGLGWAEQRPSLRRLTQPLARVRQPLLGNLGRQTLVNPSDAPTQLSTD